jgi:hypothetical protein
MRSRLCMAAFGLVAVGGLLASHMTGETAIPICNMEIPENPGPLCGCPCTKCEDRAKAACPINWWSCEGEDIGKMGFHVSSACKTTGATENDGCEWDGGAGTTCDLHAFGMAKRTNVLLMSFARGVGSVTEYTYRAT